MTMGSLHGGAALDVSSAQEAEFCLRVSGKRPPSSEHLLTLGSMSRLRIPGSFESRHARALAASTTGFRRQAGPAQREAAARASTVEMIASSPSGMRLSSLADALPGGRPSTRPQQHRPRSHGHPFASPIKGNLPTWAEEEERVQMLRALAAEPVGAPAESHRAISSRQAGRMRRGHQAAAAPTRLRQTRGTGELLDPQLRFLEPPAGSSDRYLLDGQRQAGDHFTASLSHAPGSPSGTNCFQHRAKTADSMLRETVPAGTMQGLGFDVGQQIRMQVPPSASLLRNGGRVGRSSRGRMDKPVAGKGPLVQLPGQGLLFVRDAVTPVTEQVRSGHIRPAQVLRAACAKQSGDTFWRRNEESPDPRARQLGRSHVARALLQSRLAARLGPEAHSMDLGPAFFVHGGWEQASNHGMPFSPLRDSPTLRQGTFADAESSRGDVALGASRLNQSSRRRGGVVLHASSQGSAAGPRRAVHTTPRRPKTSVAATGTSSDWPTGLFGDSMLASPVRASSAATGLHERKEMEAFEQRHQRKAITDLTSGELATLLLENELELPLAGLSGKAIRERIVSREDMIQAALYLTIGPPLGEIERRPNMDPMSG